MKKTLRTILSIILLLLFVLCAASCNSASKTGLWKDATYHNDTSFGEGAKTAIVEVKADDRTVIFTINTDKNTVGEALLEHGLISGEDGPYGLYIKVVNGITADFEVDQSYWSFYINGEYAMTGVESTEIADGYTYRLEYTK